jgi:hypothetical protein
LAVEQAHEEALMDVPHLQALHRLAVEQAHKEAVASEERRKRENAEIEELRRLTPAVSDECH